MMLARELPIGLADLLERGAAAYPQQVVVVVFGSCGHRSRFCISAGVSPRPRSRSSGLQLGPVRVQFGQLVLLARQLLAPAATFLLNASPQRGLFLIGALDPPVDPADLLLQPRSLGAKTQQGSAHLHRPG